MASRGPRRLTVAASPGSLSRILDDLDLPTRASTLVINGGTSSDSDFPADDLLVALRSAVEVVDREVGPVIITGGTDAGLFTLLGQAVGASDFAGPVIGVVPTGRVDRPDGTPLEPHHTDVIMVSGEDWGDETATMLELCAELDRRGPVVVIIAGGGTIARNEIEGHRAARRPVIVLTGTGRLADDLAGQSTPPTGLQFCPVVDVAGISSVLHAQLTG